MKKAVILLLLFCIVVSMFGCNSQDFSFIDIDNIDDIKCLVSIKSPSNVEIENGISDGSNVGYGNFSDIIEDPTIKSAYSLLSDNAVVISEFDIDDEDWLIYLTFYSGDEPIAKEDNDKISYYGTFVITKTGKFVARSTPDSDKDYYYQGEEDLYNKITAIISCCKI